MAFYDYKCPKCGLEAEIEKPMKLSDEKVVCTCGEFMDKCVSKPTIVFNGPGWQSNKAKGIIK